MTTSTDAVSLLKQLGLGASAPSVKPSSQAIEGASFADLLSKARSGELTSNRPVTIGDDAGVALSADELAQISLAADKAEAAGIRTALVMIGGQKLTLDVSSRTITGAAQGVGGVFPGMDGVIDLSNAAGASVEKLSAAATGKMSLPGAGTTSHPGVLKALAGTTAAA